MSDEARQVYCEDCTNAISRLDGKERAANRWLCMRFRRKLRPNFVSRRLLIEEPYHRCKTMNPLGFCDQFEPLSKAQENG